MRTLSALTLSLLLCFAACGGNSSNNSSGSGSGGGSASVPQFQHVAIVVLENASYHDVIGNTQMPWLNNLAGQYASLQSYYATAHPSIPNYFMLTTGQTITFDDAYSSTVSSDNLARAIAGAGLTWKAY